MCSRWLFEGTTKSIQAHAGNCGAYRVHMDAWCIYADASVASRSETRRTHTHTHRRNGGGGDGGSMMLTSIQLQLMQYTSHRFAWRRSPSLVCTIRYGRCFPCEFFAVIQHTIGIFNIQKLMGFTWRRLTLGRSVSARFFYSESKHSDGRFYDMSILKASH